MSDCDGESSDAVLWRGFINSIRLSLDESVQLVNEDFAGESYDDNRKLTPGRSVVANGKSSSSRKRRRRPRPAIHYSEDGGVLGNLPPPEGSQKLSGDKSADCMAGKGTEMPSESRNCSEMEFDPGKKKSGGETDVDLGKRNCNSKNQYFVAGCGIYDEKTHSWNLWYRPFEPKDSVHSWVPTADGKPDFCSQYLHIASISTMEDTKSDRIFDFNSENRSSGLTAKSINLHETMLKPPTDLFQILLRRREMAQLFLDALADAPPLGLVESSKVATELSTRNNSKIEYGKPLLSRWNHIRQEADGDLNLRNFFRAAGKVALGRWPPLPCPTGWKLQTVDESCIVDEKLPYESFAYRGLIELLLLDCMRTESTSVETVPLDVVWPRFFKDKLDESQAVLAEPGCNLPYSGVGIEDDVSSPLEATSNNLHVMRFVSPESTARTAAPHQTIDAMNDNDRNTEMVKAEDVTAERAHIVGDAIRAFSDAKPPPTLSSDAPTQSLALPSESSLSPNLHKKLAIQIKVTSLDDKSTAVAEAIIPSEPRHTVECLVSTLDTKGTDIDGRGIGCQGSPRVRLIGQMTNTDSKNRCFGMNQEPSGNTLGFVHDNSGLDCRLEDVVFSTEELGRSGEEENNGNSFEAPCVLDGSADNDLLRVGDPVTPNRRRICSETSRERAARHKLVAAQEELEINPSDGGGLTNVGTVVDTRLEDHDVRGVDTPNKLLLASATTATAVKPTDVSVSCNSGVGDPPPAESAEAENKASSLQHENFTVNDINDANRLDKKSSASHDTISTTVPKQSNSCDHGEGNKRQPGDNGNPLHQGKATAAVEERALQKPSLAEATLSYLRGSARDAKEPPEASSFPERENESQSADLPPCNTRSLHGEGTIPTAGDEQLLKGPTHPAQSSKSKHIFENERDNNEDLRTQSTQVSSEATPQAASDSHERDKVAKTDHERARKVAHDECGNSPAVRVEDSVCRGSIGPERMETQSECQRRVQSIGAATTMSAMIEEDCSNASLGSVDRTATQISQVAKRNSTNNMAGKFDCATNKDLRMEDEGEAQDNGCALEDPAFSRPKFGRQKVDRNDGEGNAVESKTTPLPTPVNSKSWGGDDAEGAQVDRDAHRKERLPFFVREEAKMLPIAAMPVQNTKLVQSTEEDENCLDGVNDDCGDDRGQKSKSDTEKGGCGVVGASTENVTVGDSIKDIQLRGATSQEMDQAEALFETPGGSVTLSREDDVISTGPQSHLEAALQGNEEGSSEVMTASAQELLLPGANTSSSYAAHALTSQTTPARSVTTKKIAPNLGTGTSSAIASSLRVTESRNANGPSTEGPTVKNADVVGRKSQGITTVSQKVTVGNGGKASDSNALDQTTRHHQERWTSEVRTILGSVNPEASCYITASKQGTFGVCNKQSLSTVDDVYFVSKGNAVEVDKSNQPTGRSMESEAVGLENQYSRGFRMAVSIRLGDSNKGVGGIFKSEEKWNDPNGEGDQLLEASCGSHGVSTGADTSCSQEAGRCETKGRFGESGSVQGAKSQREQEGKEQGVETDKQRIQESKGGRKCVDEGAAMPNAQEEMVCEAGESELSDGRKCQVKHSFSEGEANNVDEWLRVNESQSLRKRESNAQKDGPEQKCAYIEDLESSQLSCQSSAAASLLHAPGQCGVTRDDKSLREELPAVKSHFARDETKTEPTIEKTIERNADETLGVDSSKCVAPSQASEDCDASNVECQVDDSLRVDELQSAPASSSTQEDGTKMECQAHSLIQSSLGLNDAHTLRPCWGTGPKHDCLQGDRTKIATDDADGGLCTSRRDGELEGEAGAGRRVSGNFTRALASSDSHRALEATSVDCEVSLADETQGGGEKGDDKAAAVCAQNEGAVLHHKADKSPAIDEVESFVERSTEVRLDCKMSRVDGSQRVGDNRDVAAPAPISQEDGSELRHQPDANPRKDKVETSSEKFRVMSCEMSRVDESQGDRGNNDVAARAIHAQQEGADLHHQADANPHSKVDISETVGSISLNCEVSGVNESQSATENRDVVLRPSQPQEGGSELHHNADASPCNEKIETSTETFRAVRLEISRVTKSQGARRNRDFAAPASCAEEAELHPRADTKAHNDTSDETFGAINLDCEISGVNESQGARDNKDVVSSPCHAQEGSELQHKAVAIPRDDQAGISAETPTTISFDREISRVIQLQGARDNNDVASPASCREQGGDERRHKTDGSPRSDQFGTSAETSRAITLDRKISEGNDLQRNSDVAATAACAEAGETELHQKADTNRRNVKTDASHETFREISLGGGMSPAHETKGGGENRNDQASASFTQNEGAVRQHKADTSPHNEKFGTSAQTSRAFSLDCEISGVIESQNSRDEVASLASCAEEGGAERHHKADSNPRKDKVEKSPETSRMISMDCAIAGGTELHQKADTNARKDKGGTSDETHREISLGCEMSRVHDTQRGGGNRDDKAVAAYAQNEGAVLHRKAHTIPRNEKFGTSAETCRAISLDCGVSGVVESQSATDEVASPASCAEERGADPDHKADKNPRKDTVETSAATSRVISFDCEISGVIESKEARNKVTSLASCAEGGAEPRQKAGKDKGDTFDEAHREISMNSDMSRVHETQCGGENRDDQASASFFQKVGAVLHREADTTPRNDKVVTSAETRTVIGFDCGPDGLPRFDVSENVRGTSEGVVLRETLTGLEYAGAESPGVLRSAGGTQIQSQADGCLQADGSNCQSKERKPCSELAVSSEIDERGRSTVGEEDGFRERNLPFAKGGKDEGANCAQCVRSEGETSKRKEGSRAEMFLGTTPLPRQGENNGLSSTLASVSSRTDDNHGATHEESRAIGLRCHVDHGSRVDRPQSHCNDGATALTIQEQVIDVGPQADKVLRGDISTSEGTTSSASAFVPSDSVGLRDDESEGTRRKSDEGSGPKIQAKMRAGIENKTDEGCRVLGSTEERDGPPSNVAPGHGGTKPHEVADEGHGADDSNGQRQNSNFVPSSHAAEYIQDDVLAQARCNCDDRAEADNSQGYLECEEDPDRGVADLKGQTESVTSGLAKGVCATPSVECQVDEQLLEDQSTTQTNGGAANRNNEICPECKLDESTTQEKINRCALDVTITNAPDATFEVDAVEGDIASVVAAMVAKAISDTRIGVNYDETENGSKVCSVSLQEGHREDAPGKEIVADDIGNSGEVSKSPTQEGFKGSQPLIQVESDAAPSVIHGEVNRMSGNGNRWDYIKSEGQSLGKGAAGGDGCIEASKSQEAENSNVESSSRSEGKIHVDNPGAKAELPLDSNESSTASTSNADIRNGGHDSTRMLESERGASSAHSKLDNMISSIRDFDCHGRFKCSESPDETQRTDSNKCSSQESNQTVTDGGGFDSCAVDRQKVGHNKDIKNVDPSKGKSTVLDAALQQRRETKAGHKEDGRIRETQDTVDSTDSAQRTSSRESVASIASHVDAKPRQVEAEMEKKTGDRGLKCVEEEVQLFASHFDIGTESSLGRPKRRIKAVVRFQPTPLSYAEEKKNVSYKTGTGFQCPQCKTLCQYDAQECPFCALKCCYIAGTGVVVLRDRTDVGRDFPSFDVDGAGVGGDAAKDSDPLIETSTPLDSISKSARREARRKAARKRGRQLKNQTKLGADDDDPPVANSSKKRARNRKNTTTDEALPSPPRYHGNVSQDNLSEDLKPWECETCLQVHTAKTFQRHRYRTHGLQWNEYGCPYCNCRFDTMESRLDHITSEHPDSVTGNSVEKCGFLLYFCRDCDYTHTVIGMSNHWRHAHGNDHSFSPHSLPLVCYFCIVEDGKDGKKQQFDTIQSLEDHVAEHHAGCTLITGKKLKEPQATQQQDSTKPQQSIQPQQSTQQPEVPSRRSKRTKKAPSFYGDSDEGTSENAEVGKEESAESTEAKSALQSRRKRKLEAKECAQDERVDSKRVQSDAHRTDLDHVKLLESFGKEAAALGTKRRSITDVMEDVDNKIRSLEEKIELRRKREVNEGTTSSAVTLDLEDEDYTCEARLFNRSLRERQQQADGERIEKERFKEQCTSHLIVLKYQNRNKKKNMADIELDNLESRAIRQMSADEYKSICEDSSKTGCSEGIHCGLCNGVYASSITLTQTESANARTDFDTQDNKGGMDDIRGEGKEEKLLSPGFREIGFEALYTSDSEDEEELDQGLSTPFDSELSDAKTVSEYKEEVGERPKKKPRGESTSALVENDQLVAQKPKSEESSRAQQRGRLQQQNRRLKRAAWKWTDLRYCLHFVKAFNMEERLPFERHVVRGGSGSCRVVNYQASHR